MIISFMLDQNGNLTQGKFAINEKEKSDITCINFNENLKMFFCGHNSGNISAWKISEEINFLVCVANSNENIRVHDDIVNYITFKDNFLISCSSDNYLKVFNLDNNFENVLAKNYECVRKNIIKI
jgi:WD40 repeat protein